MWVPYGWVALPVFLADDDEAKKGKKKVKTPLIGAFLHLPIFEKAWTSSTPGAAWRGWNMEYLDKYARTRSHEARAALVRRFIADVGELA